MNYSERLTRNSGQANRVSTKPNALIGSARSPRVRAWALRLAQVGWVVIVALSIGMFVVSIPARALQLLQVGYSTVGPLQVLRLPVGFVGYYIGTLDAIVFLTFVSIGILIFWRKPDEWISL